MPLELVLDEEAILKAREEGFPREIFDALRLDSNPDRDLQGYVDRVRDLRQEHIGSGPTARSDWLIHYDTIFSVSTLYFDKCAVTQYAATQGLITDLPFVVRVGIQDGQTKESRITSVPLCLSKRLDKDYRLVVGKLEFKPKPIDLDDLPPV